MSALIVKSAQRVLRVFELFAEERTPLTAAEISRRLRWPKSSANVLLRSLVSLGYLCLDGATLEYFPSPRLMSLSDWIPDAFLAGRGTLHLLTELRDLTGETVTLSVQNGFSMQFVSVLTGTNPNAVAMRAGFTASIFASAVGLAFLAAQPDHGIRRLMQRVNHRTVQAEHVGIAQVFTDVRMARERGYAIAYESLFANTGAVAFALPSGADGRTVVVGLGGAAVKIRRHELRFLEAMRSKFGVARTPLMGPGQSSPIESRG